ncbi:MAG: hypothetical protein WA175_08520 [Candidatus Acidiferrales bacterium]
MKKLVPAVVLAYAWLMATGYLINGVWLMRDYMLTPDSWRPQAVMQHKFWIMWAAELLFTVMFVWIYSRGLEKKPWVGQGIRYGIVMSLLVMIPESLSEYVIYRVNHILALKWMVSGTMQFIVMGLIVAFVYKAPSPEV